MALTLPWVVIEDIWGLNMEWKNVILWKLTMQLCHIYIYHTIISDNLINLVKFDVGVLLAWVTYKCNRICFVENALKRYFTAGRWCTERSYKQCRIEHVVQVFIARGREWGLLIISSPSVPSLSPSLTYIGLSTISQSVTWKYCNDAKKVF